MGTVRFADIVRIVIVLSIVTLFASCGGGGGGSSSGTNNGGGESNSSAYGISGTVTVNSGSALQGVTITLSGAGAGSATTDANGNYTFTGLANGSYTLTPSLSGYTFSPANCAKTVNGANIPSVNFTASASTSTSASWAMFGHDRQHTGRSQYVGTQTATLKWAFTPPPLYIYAVYSSPAIGLDGTVYVGSMDVYALDGATGEQKWVFTTSFGIMSSPAIGADGTVYVGSRDNKVYAVDGAGHQKWAFTTGGEVWSSPAIGADGTVYVGSFDGKLYAIGE